MNPIAEVAVPVHATPEALLLLALVALVAGVRMLTTINTNYWGCNRLLYIVSWGNPAVGNILAPIPGLAAIGVAIWAVGRVVGFI